MKKMFAIKMSKFFRKSGLISHAKNISTSRITLRKHTVDWGDLMEDPKLPERQPTENCKWNFFCTASKIILA